MKLKWLPKVLENTKLYMQFSHIKNKSTMHSITKKHIHSLFSKSEISNCIITTIQYNPSKG